MQSHTPPESGHLLCRKLCKRLLFTSTGFTTLTSSNKGILPFVDFGSIESESIFVLPKGKCIQLCINLSSLVFRWYQIKITMRWEDGEMMSVATPARVVQYEGISSVYCVEVDACSANPTFCQFLSPFPRPNLSDKV